MKLTLAALILFSGITYIQAKDLEPFCGVRPFIARSCENDDSCSYSDDLKDIIIAVFSIGAQSIYHCIWMILVDGTLKIIGKECSMMKTLLLNLIIQNIFLAKIYQIYCKCAAVTCPVGYSCWYGQCYKRPNCVKNSDDNNDDNGGGDTVEVNPAVTPTSTP